MKIDVTQKVLGLNDVEMGDLRQFCCTALDTLMRGDEGLSGDDKRKLGDLADSISRENKPDLRITEWATVLTRCERLFSPVQVRSISRLIDIKDKADEPTSTQNVAPGRNARRRSN